MSPTRAQEALVAHQKTRFLLRTELTAHLGDWSIARL